MAREVRNYKIKVIPFIKTSEDDEGKTIKTPIYERTSKPSEKSKEAGYNADKFFHLELSEASDNPLRAAQKAFTMILFKQGAGAHFSAIKNAIDNDEFEKLSDLSIILKLEYPGLVLERKCIPYFGTEIKEGKEKIRFVRKKKVNRETGEITYAKEQMVVDTVKFFAFANEVEDESGDGVEIAYQREFKRHSEWLVTANASADEAKTETNTTQEDDVDGE